MSYFKATAWKELVLACIGEQFSSECSENDEITGISVSIREREDLIQIWNSNSIEADRATVIEKIKNELLPEVQFSAVFYKGNLIFCVHVALIPIYDANFWRRLVLTVTNFGPKPSFGPDQLLTQIIFDSFLLLILD